VIPLTVPRVVLDSLSNRGQDRGRRPDGFQLVFSIDKQSPLQILFLLSGGMPLLFMRVVSSPPQRVANVLIDGVITNNENLPATKLELNPHHHRQRPHRAHGSIRRSGFPSPLPPERVSLCSSQVCALGIISSGHPQHPALPATPIEQNPAQQGTDLAYIRYLADQVAMSSTSIRPVPGSASLLGPQIKIDTAASLNPT